MSISTVVTRGYGLFSAAHFVVTRGYSQGAEPPPPPPPPPSPIVPQAYGFDAGPAAGFGKWFNLAYGPSSSSTRRPARRDTDLGRMLDELVYGDEPDLEAEDAEEAAEIVQEAARAVAERGDDAQDGIAARALVSSQMRAYQAVLNVVEAEARRLFLAALVRQARADWQAAIADRIAQDDADLLVFAEIVL